MLDQWQTLVWIRRRRNYKRKSTLRILRIISFRRNSTSPFILIWDFRFLLDTLFFRGRTGNSFDMKGNCVQAQCLLKASLFQWINQRFNTRLIWEQLKDFFFFFFKPYLFIYLFIMGRHLLLLFSILYMLLCQVRTHCSCQNKVMCSFLSHLDLIHSFFSRRLPRASSSWSCRSFWTRRAYKATRTAVKVGLPPHTSSASARLFSASA